MAKIVTKLVEVFIYRKTDDGIKYLLLKRNESEFYPGIWSVAGGRIGENEKAYETAIREMEEETGLIAEYFYKLDRVNTFYEMRDDEIHLVPLFLAEAKNAEVKLSEEHSEFKWMSFDEACENIYWTGWKENINLINDILSNENLFRTLEEIKLRE